jgi:hypothetical protein
MKSIKVKYCACKQVKNKSIKVKYCACKKVKNKNPYGAPPPPEHGGSVAI